MLTKILITIGLMMIAMPIVGIVLGLGIGHKAEKLVYPIVLILWGTIIYIVWFK